MNKSFPSPLHIFILLCLVLTCIEIYCSWLSYENYGWVMPYFLYLLIFVNVGALVMFLKDKKILAIITLLVIGIAIIPLQLTMAKKHLRCHQEVSAITNFLYQQKIQTGKFPENLNGYSFRYPKLKDDINYYKDKEDRFEIHYSVGTHNTSHFFIHDKGNVHWEYYDD